MVPIFNSTNYTNIVAEITGIWWPVFWVCVETCAQEFYDRKASGSKWNTVKWKLHLPQPPRKRWSPEKTWSGAPNGEPSSTKYMWPTVCPGDRWEVNFKLPNIKVSASVIPLKKNIQKLHYTISPKDDRKMNILIKYVLDLFLR